jgi:hypothetical protein
MKKYQILGLALVAVFALSALVASTAGAVEFLLAEWLSAGAKITTAQATEAEGELELHSTNGGDFGVSSKLLCSGIFLGTAGPVSEDTVTTLLNLKLEEISKTELSGAGLSCTSQENCTEPLVWADELPWKTELELMVDGSETFFVDLLLKAGYYVECLILGVTINELCTTPTTAVKVTNETGGVVDQEFKDAFQTLAGLTLAECTLGGKESAEVTGLGTEKLTSGAALTASSE